MKTLQVERKKEPVNPLTPHPYKKADIQVYQTTDYSMFSFARGNREVNELHLNRLLKSISKHYLFTIIIVNENFEVIDGQHRLACLKQLNLPVYFMILTGYGLDEIQIFNLNSRNWNNADYLSGFIDKGKQDYIDYKRFRTKYKFGHRESIFMLTQSSGREVSVDSVCFNQGNFKIKDYTAACRMAESIYRVEPFFPSFKERGFVTALIHLLLNVPSFDMDKFISKCELSPILLKKCATRDQYIDMIEQLYNYRSQNKVSLKY